MKKYTFKKKISFLKPLFWLTLLFSYIFAAYLNDTLHFLTYLFSIWLTLYLMKSVFHNIYIPLTGCLAVDESDIKLDAGCFSWSSALEPIYKKEVFFLLVQYLYITEKETAKKIIVEPNSWRSVDDQGLGLSDVLAQHINIKPYSEMPNVPVGFKDYEPTIKKVLIFLMSLFLVLLLASMVVHRYYSHNSGTPVLFHFGVGLLFTGAVYFYLYRNKVNSESNVPVIILACIIGLFSAPVIFKGYIIAFNDVETHHFQLVKKNGGYQHWKSLEDETLELRLGSVNSKIHTENDQGAIVMIKLIRGKYLTLYLPDQVEVTRYKANAITVKIE